MRSVLLALFLAAASAPAMAQQQTVPVMMKVSAGTGFFINHMGDVVTNAHVVPGCEAISVKTLTGERAATLTAIDKERDLAVLHVAGGNIPAIASLRWDIRNLKVGDTVVVMGYPGQEGIAGQYQFKKSTVTELYGPSGEPKWLQLGSVAQHGNSGGPVLDTMGNVIAVITGNTQTTIYQVDANNQRIEGTGKPAGNADVGITLPVLEDFLRLHHISYYQASSGGTPQADIMLERRANRFILPIRCYLKP